MFPNTLLGRYSKQVILLTFIASFCSAGYARAALMLTPAGLNPGDLFRVAFVSSTARDATSGGRAIGIIFSGQRGHVGWRFVTEDDPFFQDFDPEDRLPI